MCALERSADDNATGSHHLGKGPVPRVVDDTVDPAGLGGDLADPCGIGVIEDPHAVVFGDCARSVRGGAEHQVSLALSKLG